MSWLPLIVGVKEGDELCFGGEDSGVARSRGSAVRAPDVSDVVKVGLKCLFKLCGVRRAVVYDDDLVIIRGLREDRLQRIRDEMRRVVSRNHDAEIEWVGLYGSHSVPLVPILETRNTMLIPTREGKGDEALIYRSPVLVPKDRPGMRGRRKTNRYFTSTNADLPTGNNNRNANVVTRITMPLAAMFSIVLWSTTKERKARQARKAAIDASTKGARWP